MLEVPCVVKSLEYRSMSKECEEQIAARLTDVRRKVANNTRIDSSADVVIEFVRLARHPLTDSMLLNLLRSGSFNSVCTWLRLGASSPNGVRVNVVKELLSDYRKSTPDTLSNENLRGALFAACPSVEGLIDTLIEHYDSYIGSSLGRTDVINALYPVLVKNFGSDSLESPNMRESWESFLTFASDWNDTATALIHTVVELNDSSKRNLQTIEHSQLEFVW